MSTLEFGPAVELLGHWLVRQGAPTVAAEFVDAIPQGSPVTPLDGPDAVERLLTDFVEQPLGRPLDEPTRVLIAALAAALATEAGELVQVTTATPGELVVVGKNAEGGKVFGLSLTPATQTDPADPFERLRLTCAVLGEYVWLNNNDRLDVDVSAERHGLDDPTDLPAFAAWWPTSTTAERLLGHLWDEPGPPVPVDDVAWTEFAEWFHEHNDAGARSGAWAMELIDDDALGDPEARYPGDRLVGRLGDEVLAGARELAGADVRAVYGIGVPLPDNDSDDDEDFGVIAAVMFVGDETVSVLTVSASV
ncbi:hypothetical protein AB0I28_29325 [Phytomonospora sp. NPDC050363]|uniref:hypothetical protein n=1 Tax=Phytomonospora sp. NPDC050363 TaxID=3155642 RepID=UPI0033D184D5